MAKITTLAEFITEQQVLKPEATGNLSLFAMQGHSITLQK